MLCSNCYFINDQITCDTSPMKIIRLITCKSTFEAHILKNKLDNEGIPCFLTNENFSSLMPHYDGMMGSGIQVMIEEQDHERASKSISSHTDKIVQNCPNCASENISFGLGPNKYPKILFVILSLVFFMPMTNIKNTYFCRDCKTEF